MKKKSKSRIKHIISYVFQLRTWSDWNRIKSYFLYITQMAKHLFVIPTSVENSIAFEKAMERHNLTEKQLKKQVNDLNRLFAYMLCASCGVLFYLVYQFMYGTVMGILLSFIVWMISVVLAFRYSYWSFVIRKRSLDCSLNDWFQNCILGKNK